MPSVKELSSGPRKDLARALGVRSYPCPPQFEEEWDKCKNDPVYFIETYIRTYDPRRAQDDRWVSFILWEVQKEYMAWLKTQYEAQNQCVVCKCRTMGASWLTLCFALHIWIFESDAKITLGSYKEEKIDSPGNMDSLFQKARSVLKSLPSWMMPPGFEYRVHDLKLKLINPYNGSVMTGESGDNCGTGGRSSFYCFDEFAKTERSLQVQAAIQDNSRFIVYVSTPEGTANEFGRMVQEKVHPTFFFTVYDDPTRNGWVLLDGPWEIKDSKFRILDGVKVLKSGNGHDAPAKAVYPYLEEERLKRDPVNFAQEVLGDLYASAKEQMFPREWVRAAVRFKCKAEGPIVAGLDLGGGTRMSTILTPRQGPKVLGQQVSAGVSSPDKVNSLMYEVGEAQTPDGRRIELVTYDASGETGMEFAKAIAGKKFQFTLVPFMGQKAPSNRMWPDGKTSAERFATLRTEACFILRERFKKTYEKVHGIYDHPDEQCISIPDDPELVDQLMPYFSEPTETGKLKVASKVKMRSLGVKFVDKADSLIYSYATDYFETKVYNRNNRN